eukprot:3523526-Pyramimonas_sp.AAC.1
MDLAMALGGEKLASFIGAQRSRSRRTRSAWRSGWIGQGFELSQEKLRCPTGLPFRAHMRLTRAKMLKHLAMLWLLGIAPRLIAEDGNANEKNG